MALISHSRKFVFIKTMKTAGTSMEVHLSQWMAEGDIVTPIYPANVDHHPRNYLVVDGGDYYNHMSMDEIRVCAGIDVKNYFSFCFERHPVQKCLSFFGMLQNSPTHRASGNARSWAEYLERGEFPVDTGRYTDASGRCIVDRVYRYEEMDAAIVDIARRIGIPAQPLVVREKAGLRRDIPSFEDVMASSAERDHIMKAFASSLAIVPY